MKIKLYFLITLTTTVFYSCSTPKSKDEAIVIDLEHTFDNSNEANLRLFADSIQYIPLETNSEIFENYICGISIVNDRIIVVGYPKILLFDLNSGKFIREIGHVGKDPDGYQMWENRCIMDTVIYTQGWKPKTHIIYGFHSEILDTIEVPIEYSTLYPGKFNDSEIYAYRDNLEGNEDSRLYSINKSGKYVKYFKNYQKYQYAGAFTSSPLNLYYFKGETRFKERFNDTIFEIDNDVLQAKYVFNCGDRSMPYEQRGTIKFIDEGKFNYYDIKKVLESAQYLFYNFRFHKREYSSLFIKKTHGNYIAKKDLNKEIGKIRFYGFHNDIDNFLPFSPQSITSDGNYLVGYKEMVDVVKWFEDNPEKVAQLPDPLKKLGEKSDTDNIIVMVVKLKQ